MSEMFQQDVCVLYRGPPPTLAVACLSHSGLSYADRVKCSQALPVPNQSVSVPTEKPGQLQLSTLWTADTKITYEGKPFCAFCVIVVIMSACLFCIVCMSGVYHQAKKMLKAGRQCSGAAP